MLLTITDKNNAAQVIATDAQEAITDHSGTIASTGVSQLAVAANVLRSGLFIQNLSATNSMNFNVGALATTGAGSVKLAPGAMLHIPKEFPLSTGAVNILGTAADSFTIKEW